MYLVECNRHGFPPCIKCFPYNFVDPVHSLSAHVHVVDQLEIFFTDFPHYCSIASLFDVLTRLLFTIESCLFLGFCHLYADT